MSGDDERIDVGELLRSAGRQLRTDFQEIQNCNPHAGERGGEAEDILKQFLRERLPKRFGVESGLVIGADGAVSRQTDVIVFDAFNSPVYRSGSKLQILPRDNVAAVIEVKSKLNKEELFDAANKIASVKKIKASPICGIDQPVTFNDMIMTGTLGCVFAFDSYTSLESLAENLRDINGEHESTHWIDLVVVLDKGSIGYTLQRIYDRNMAAWDGGPLHGDFMVPPLYVHLVLGAFGESTLNHFFLKLMTHLTFFRKITSLSLSALLGNASVKTVQGYQFKLNRQLVPVSDGHQSGRFQKPKIRFNLYLKGDRRFVGHVSLLPWQDGAVVMCSTLLPPQMILAQYFSRLNLRSNITRAGANVNVWTSYVLKIADEDFIRVSEQLHPDLISVRGGEDDSPPPMTI
jgi:hypothetical protein